MRFLTFFVLATLRLSHVLGGELAKALELIVRHHGHDAASLQRTLRTLSHIVTRLNETPNEDKYRRVRLLNTSFWERVGKVEGGIAFMTALGFELVERKGEQNWVRRWYHLRISNAGRASTLSMTLRDRILDETQHVQEIAHRMRHASGSNMPSIWGSKSQ